MNVSNTISGNIPGRIQYAFRRQPPPRNGSCEVVNILCKTPFAFEPFSSANSCDVGIQSGANSASNHGLHGDEQVNTIR